MPARWLLPRAHWSRWHPWPERLGRMSSSRAGDCGPAMAEAPIPVARSRARQRPVPEPRSQNGGRCSGISSAIGSRVFLRSSQRVRRIHGRRRSSSRPAGYSVLEEPLDRPRRPVGGLRRLPVRCRAADCDTEHRRKLGQLLTPADEALEPHSVLRRALDRVGSRRHERPWKAPTTPSGTPRRCIRAAILTRYVVVDSRRRLSTRHPARVGSDDPTLLAAHPTPCSN